MKYAVQLRMHKIFSQRFSHIISQEENSFPKYLTSFLNVDQGDFIVKDL